jgi:O-acetyl-ADP-ribose deacetylase (regulator of RNase III)
MNTVLAERVLSTGQTIQIVQGDITVEMTEAIVNAANESLQHGAGVAGAILRGGGQVIQQESEEWVRKHGRVSHSQPAWTSGGLLPAKYVIHAVGPVWGNGDEDAKLSAAIHGSLETAEALKLTSISFPALSTGIFGFPKERAAGIMFSVIEQYFSQHTSEIELIRLVLFDESTIRSFTSVWAERSNP